jgi:membrane fusion protein, multidrug efflux system
MLQTQHSPTVARQTDAGHVRSRSRVIVWLGIAAVLLLLFAALVAWRLTTLASQAASRPRGRFGGATQPVGVTTVKAQDIRVVLDELGTVTPLATITVQPQLSGLLMKLGFEEGQIVKKGDLLAQIDQRPYEVSLHQYEGQLVRDQAALKEAEVDLERYRNLQKQDAIASQTVDDQVWQVHQDEGTVRLDQAQVDAQKLNIVYCNITSPVTGRVGIRLVDPGNYIQVGSATGIVVVTQMDPISVIFNVPEDAVPEVLKQLKVAQSLQVIAYDRANVAQLATGTLKAVDTQIDTTTGTVRMRAIFANADGILYPQQFVNIRLLVNTQHDMPAVPRNAVQYGAAGPFVYVLSDNNTVKVRAVKLGAQDGDMLAVQSGLSSGERVVTDGADQLRDGVHVSIVNERAQAGASTPQGAPGEHRRPRGAGHRSGRGSGSAAPHSAGDSSSTP